jgi:hypothetical protein
MSALEHSGPEDNFQHGAERINPAQISPEHYQAGRDDRQFQPPGKEAFGEVSRTVNGRELEVESVAASTLGLFENMQRRDAQITAPGLRNLVSAMKLNEEARGAHGLPSDQSTIPPEALARFGSFLARQEETHSSLAAREAIREVRRRYFEHA